MFHLVFLDRKWYFNLLHARIVNPVILDELSLTRKYRVHMRWKHLHFHGSKFAPFLLILLHSVIYLALSRINLTTAAP